LVRDSELGITLYLNGRRMRFSYIFMDRLATLADPSELASILSFLRETGYDGIELNLTKPLGVDADLLERLLDQTGLVVPSFLTGEAYNDGLCLSAADPVRRQGAIDRLIGYLPTARRFGAIMVVGLLQGLRRDEPDAQRAHVHIVDGLRHVAQAAEQASVEIVIEPVNHLQVGFHNSVAEVLQLIDEIGSPAIRPMVDTVHMNIEEASLTEPIRACGARLRHVHLCENHGGQLGTGHIDFAGVLQTLRAIDYNGFASVKVYRHLSFRDAAKTSLTYLRSLATA
jgi:D-psicose/D-tagatose/L-ribulose 3-epimerase